ncbi:cell division protein FtsZ [Caldovatus aquaticus]|uniref:Cell division protein FtsZ n=1 Tax=Caldovatus aquaticus TaxID=2865671 RepID=A0ABS7EYQ3_9PROT|nr:cell division protein FtsZ [Caldovatus aquaticus]MBW8267877.1 cell division protein FtsZ [Caldovatus aquaticus]
MTLTLTLPQTRYTDFSPRITVIGVGGGGTNAVNNMIAMGLDGVEFLVCNTDAQSLQHSRAERRVQLGPHLTQGLGAGAKPEIGRAAAEEATEELARHLEGAHMVFVTAGMGGGTGTGAAPVIARMARERGILTVGVVTKPFDFEGPKRRRCAEQGIEELQQYVDTLIVIPNQNLFRLANERTTFAEAFKMADTVLYMGVRGVTDLMVNPGVVNLDFADIRTVMAEMGKAMMGTGEAEGEDRAVKAAEAAISNPLLEDTSMRGARGVLINITGGLDMTLFEVDEAANRIRKEVDEEANIIFGSSIDEAMNGRIRVSVVATGIDALEAREAERPRLVAIGGGAAVAAATAEQPQKAVPAQPGAAGAAQGPGGPAAGAAAPLAGAFPATAGPGTLPFIRRAAQAATASAAAEPAAMRDPGAPPAAAPLTHPLAAAPGAEPPVMLGAAAIADGPAGAAPVAGAAGGAPLSRQAAPQPGGGAPAVPGGVGTGSPLRDIFRRVTGGASGLMKRTIAEPAAVTPAAQPPGPRAARIEPDLRGAAPAPQGGAPRPAPSSPAQDEMGMEIPAFLRRQSN